MPKRDRGRKKMRRQESRRRSVIECLEPKQLLTGFSLDVNGSQVIAVGSSANDNIELVLGDQTHTLTIAGETIQFDAAVIDTFLVGSGNGDDTIRIVGTDLDDVGKVLDNKAELSSSAYEVDAFSFDEVIFEGRGGDDYTQIFGSNGDDELQAIPQDSTLTTPTHTMKMLGFERVDSYGRHGNDYASMYGTQGDDQYATLPTFEVLQGANMVMRTTGWDRVDAFGRNGNDTAFLFDTAGDDDLYVFPEFSVMRSDTLYAVAKDFEHAEARFDNGGFDQVHFRDLTAPEHVFANGNIATVTGPGRSVWAWDMEKLELEEAAGAVSPSYDLRTTDFDICGIDTVTELVPVAIEIEGQGSTNAGGFDANGNSTWSTDVGGGWIRNAGDDTAIPVPTDDENSSRHEADSLRRGDTVYRLVGNTAGGGRFQKVDLSTGVTTDLITGLTVRGNDISPGSNPNPTGGQPTNYQRPRPVGGMLATNSSGDFFVASGNELHVYDGTSSSVLASLPANDTIRSIASNNTDTVPNGVTSLFLGTQLNGLVRVNLSTGATTSMTPGITRVEDVVYVPGTNLLLFAAYNQGWHVIDRLTGVVTDVTDPGFYNGGTAANPNDGNNGGRTQAISVAVNNAGAAAVGVLNPGDAPSATTWVFGTMDITAASPVWFNATPDAAIVDPATEISPSNRGFGRSAGSGEGLVGTWGLVFDPTDDDRLVAFDPLSNYHTLNFGPTAEWASYNDGLSVGSLTEIAITEDGNWMLYAASDHVLYIWDLTNPNDLPRIQKTGVASSYSDNWGVATWGTGDETKIIIGPLHDSNNGVPDARRAELNDVLLWVGNPATDSPDDVVFNSTGYNAAFTNTNGLGPDQAPRAAGFDIFPYANSTLGGRIAVFAETIGPVYADIAPDGTVGTWQVSTVSTPVPLDLLTDNTNGVRDVVFKRDGSGVGLMLSIDGDNAAFTTLLHSLDGGESWNNIFDSGTQTNRKGRIEIFDSGDWAIFVDTNGNYHRIENLSSAAPVMTQLSSGSDYAAATIDNDGNVYLHEHGALANMWYFTENDFLSNGDISVASQVASGAYANYHGNLLTELKFTDGLNGENINGVTQGSGGWFAPRLT